MYPQPPPKRADPWPWLAGIAATMLVLGVLVAAVVDMGNDEDNAIRFCQALANESLGQTAQFTQSAATHLGSNVWEVTGTVAARNPYGYTKRGDYSCTGIRPDPKQAGIWLSDGVVITTR